VNHRAFWAGAFLTLFMAPLPVNGQSFPPMVANGACTPDSYIGNDSAGSSHGATYHCDSVMVALGVGALGRVMVAFADNRAANAKPLAFAGRSRSIGVVVVDRLYLPNGEVTPVTDGVCRLFFTKRGSLSDAVCGAEAIRESGRVHAAAIFRAAIR
jgi:hypothetical protein